MFNSKNTVVWLAFFAFPIAASSAYAQSEFSTPIESELETRFMQTGMENPVDLLDAPAASARGKSEGKLSLMNVWVKVAEWGQAKQWKGYAGFGGGALETRNGEVEETLYAGQLGMGVKYTPNSQLSIDAGFRHVDTESADFSLPGHSAFSTQFEDRTVGVGLKYRFHKDNKSRRFAESDGDGVFDFRDRCPDTPRGVPVDAQGCQILARSVR